MCCKLHQMVTRKYQENQAPQSWDMKNSRAGKQNHGNGWGKPRTPWNEIGNDYQMQPHTQVQEKGELFSLQWFLSSFIDKWAVTCLKLETTFKVRRMDIWTLVGVHRITHCYSPAAHLPTSVSAFISTFLRQLMPGLKVHHIPFAFCYGYAWTLRKECLDEHTWHAYGQEVEKN